jgi:hypothetical protein
MAKYSVMQEVPEEIYLDDEARKTIEGMFDEHLAHQGLTRNIPWIVSWSQGWPTSYENSYPPLKWLRVQLVIHGLWRVRYLRRRVRDPRTYTTYQNWVARGVTDVTPPEDYGVNHAT